MGVATPLKIMVLLCVNQWKIIRFVAQVSFIQTSKHLNTLRSQCVWMSETICYLFGFKVTAFKFPTSKWQDICGVLERKPFSSCMSSVPLSMTCYSDELPLRVGLYDAVQWKTFEGENFREFEGFVAICKSFLCKIWKCGVTSEQSAKVFSHKSFLLLYIYESHMSIASSRS